MKYTCPHCKKVIWAASFARAMDRRGWWFTDMAPFIGCADCQIMSRDQWYEEQKQREKARSWWQRVQRRWFPQPWD